MDWVPNKFLLERVKIVGSLNNLINTIIEEGDFVL